MSPYWIALIVYIFMDVVDVALNLRRIRIGSATACLVASAVMAAWNFLSAFWAGGATTWISGLIWTGITAIWVYVRLHRRMRLLLRSQLAAQLERIEHIP